MIYETKVNYLGQEVKLSTDSFRELHQTMAGIAELNADYRALYAYVRAEFGVENPRSLTAAYRVDSEENEYYGVTCGRTRCDLTFGQSRSKDRPVPFFPKGQDNVFDPRKGRQRSAEPAGETTSSNGHRDDVYGAPPTQARRGGAANDGPAPRSQRTAVADASEFPGRAATAAQDGSYQLSPIDDELPF